MKTVYAHFSNHFDLTWRRCWERDYLYQGGRYASYRRIEELCLLANIALAEQGEGAYAVEQALTMRAFLETHPEALPRLQALYAQGLFEVCGAGEAIIDVNMCSGETLCRNLASGVRYCRDVLGMPPLLANHGDGFGSSAQFPQVIRGCGLPGIQGMSYCTPDNRYWRGLDGSTVLVAPGVPGRGYFFDHCYHEPCRVCKNLAPDDCPACRGTGFDLPQNFYPPFEPVAEDKFRGEVAQYNVCSEEMLPPEQFTTLFRRWQEENPAVTYRWGTSRLLAYLWQPLAETVDHAPDGMMSSRVENNPVQTGCYVSRSRVKAMARRLESEFYGWEKALMLTAGDRLDRARWEALFRELPLAFFHDAITGTHQDEAAQELLDRMRACMDGIHAEARRMLELSPKETDIAMPGAALAVFAPQAATVPLRALLPEIDWRTAPLLVAVDESGTRHPVTLPFHRFSPALPPEPSRLVDPVGPTARTRPEQVTPRVELANIPPLAWSHFHLEQASEPQPLIGRALSNSFYEVTLGDDGVEAIRDVQSGQIARGDVHTIGELLLDEDEGDPWGTRKIPAFRHGLRGCTHFLGAARFAGYQEAWYGGRYEPNLRFAHEADPKIFSLEWYVTFRLPDAAHRIDVSYEIFWKAADRRIRAIFPVQAPADSGYHSIPAGWLTRERYEQQDTCLWSPNGDWPALHFVATRADEGGHGWALVNHGTPSARIADGAMLMSLLRSPGFGHCLERYAQEYPMPTSGIRDGGWHHFEYQLLSHTGEADIPRLALHAAALNQSAPCLVGETFPCQPTSALRISGDDVELQAVKPCFDAARSHALVIRLVNHAPAPRDVTVELPSHVDYAAWGCNLIEEIDGPLPVTHNGVQLTLQPFEIRSLLIESVT